MFRHLHEVKSSRTSSLSHEILGFDAQISATAGITRITEEHIGLLLALDMPFFAVINKCELVSNINAVVARLAQLLEPANKKPLLITDENMARNCVAPQKSILDTIDNVDEEIKKDEEVAVFPVSCVRGAGLNALHACLLTLAPRRDMQRPEDEACEFQIDEIFHVGDSTGPVVGELLARGRLYEGDELIIACARDSRRRWAWVASRRDCGRAWCC
ncbi:GTP-binding protein 2-like [Nymphalis io]|uniref:GTP-binding protein 2-like n=1 Tax=Inachis io TaxID=171585 RepID=UPI0021694BAD|nr:GTP-binding protein 2-like [Nymphalis io]